MFLRNGYSSIGHGFASANAVEEDRGSGWVGFVV